MIKKTFKENTKGKQYFHHIERQLEQQHTSILNIGQIIEKLNRHNFPQKYHSRAVLE